MQDWLHKMYLPNYNNSATKNNGTFLCQMKENQCPYRQQGKICYEVDLGTVHICNADASVRSDIEPMAKLFRKD